MKIAEYDEDMKEKATYFDICFIVLLIHYRRHNMKVEFINPFIAAAYLVLENMGNHKTEKGKLCVKSSPVAGSEVNSIIGVTGDIRGQVLYSMTAETAKKLASSMLMGMPVVEFDELCKSAINELGNMITGNAASELSNIGLNCTITPPSLVMGENVSVSFKDAQILVIPLMTDFGEFTIYVALT
jgi:chemotaxis protein CheX